MSVVLEAIMQRKLRVDKDPYLHLFKVSLDAEGLVYG